MVTPEHYQRLVIQPAAYAEVNQLSFLEGCVVKYVSRWRKKNGIEDLDKAIHCLELLKTNYDNSR